MPFRLPDLPYPKDALVEFLRERGEEVEDLGTDSLASVDYPDYGRAVARRVVAESALGHADSGV